MLAHTDRHPARLNARGFTLIEMLIVLSILGVLALIALPNIDISRYRSRSAMQTIGTTLLAAQRLAVTRQHDIIISFDETSNAILVHDDGNNDGVVDANERERRVPLGDQIIFGRGSAPSHPIGANNVTFTKQVRGRTSVTFHRGGSASEEGGFYITSRRALTGGGSPTDAKLIVVTRATGRPSWFRYTGSQWERGF